MAESDNKSANVLAQETAQLEEQLQGWREVILAGDRVLRWEKPWFPGALIGATTVVFLLIYYLDPSVLTGLSCTVMLLCLADYFVPTLALKVFGSNKWTTEQQQRFHEICNNLVKSERRVVGWWKRLCSLKEEKPKVVRFLKLRHVNPKHTHSVLPESRVHFCSTKRSFSGLQIKISADLVQLLYLAELKLGYMLRERRSLQPHSV
ncbi:ADP-ribosylation factor-like protein 6-interacting protein 1 [Ilyodon furcidens]|uniref:ADP-ribosylation factor-like protein 6-interacting protein 1 n=1 Tax=Ilyodon furcidens TaxID=33524 RepID=A0ABV0V2G5_9TELE